MSTPTDPGPVDRAPRRGSLKVFLGYAAGVGKTYRMLEEAHLLKAQGIDVILGYFESHGRKDTVAQGVGLELIPRRTIPYRGTSFQEMDAAAVIARRPAICLVDELAHTNVPGSERSKRWEDVQILLDAGINVLTTVNIQHLESLNDQVFEISGVRVRETVPDWFVKQADEVVMVDATSGALLNRLRRGDIYAPDKAQRAMDNFFKESTLGALRELALRHTALELESRETAASRPTAVPQTEPHTGPLPVAQEPSSRDRILIYLTAEASTAMLIRRGRKMADYLGADCFGVCVSACKELSDEPAEKRDAMEKHLNFAKNLHIETRTLQGKNPARALVEFALANEVTHILLARPRYNWWNRMIGTDPVLQVVREAANIRVMIAADRTRAAKAAVS